MMKEKARPAGKLNKPPGTRFFEVFCSGLVKLHAIFVNSADDDQKSLWRARLLMNPAISPFSAI